MRRMLFALAVFCGFSAAPARADFLPMFDPASLPDYTPGVPFSFNLTLPQLAQFTGYTVELVFTASADNPGLSFDVAKGSNYPFTANPFPILAVAAVDGSSPNQVHLFFSDTNLGAPASTSSGDQFVTVTVTPSAALRDEIDIEIGPATSFQHAMEDPTYLQPGVVTVGQGPPLPPSSVPAPPGALLMGVGGILLAGRRLVRRAA